MTTVDVTSQPVYADEEREGVTTLEIVGLSGSLPDDGGVRTSEFWIKGIGMILAAAIPLLVLYNVFTEEVAQQWLALMSAIVALVVPIVLTSAANNYNDNRAAVKVSAMELERTRLMWSMRE